MKINVESTTTLLMKMETTTTEEIIPIEVYELTQTARYYEIIEAIASSPYNIKERGESTTKNIKYPEELPRLRKEEIKQLLEEAEKLLKKGDRTSLIQASEKFYKIAEEVLKNLAKQYAPEIAEEAERMGRWTVTLLEKAKRRLKSKFGRKGWRIIKNAWSDAWDLHTKGFHEHQLEQEDIEDYAEDVKKLAYFYIALKI